MSAEADKKILEAIREGRNDVALNDLYKRILPKIKNLILRNSGNEEEAKDIFQDAVIILFKQVKLGKYDDQKDIAGFIYSVSRNLWINRVKNLNRSSPLVDTEYERVDSSDVEEDMITKEKKAAVHDLLSKIGDECKQLLMYSVFEGLTMKEICEKMGYSSENVAKTYNYRCKQKLVQLVKGNKEIIALFNH